MAVPALNPHDQEPDDRQLGGRPKFGVIQGGGEGTTPAGRNHLSSVPSTPQGSPEGSDQNGVGGRLQMLEGGGQTVPGRGNLSAVPSIPAGSPPGEVSQTTPPRRFGIIQGGGEKTPGGADLQSVGAMENRFKAPDETPQSTPSLFDKGATRPDSAGKAVDPDDLKKNEKDDAAAGLYRNAGVSGEPEAGGLGARFKNISRRRKLVVAGGGSGITAIIVSMLLIAPLYRLPSLMGLVENKVSAEAHHIVEKRSERFLVRYLIDRAGGSSTDYVNTGSIVSDIWTSMRSRQVEKIIADKTGITFSKTADGIVHVFQDGRDLGDAKNIDKVMKILDSGTITSKADFREILKLVVNFHRASVEARSLANRFLPGKRFGAPPERKGKTPQETAANDIQDKNAQLEKAVTEKNLTLLPDAIDCTVNSKCDTFSNDPEVTGVTNPAPNGTGDQATTDGSSTEVTTALTDAEQQAAKDVANDPSKSFINTMLEKILTKIIGAEAASTAVDAIPFIGWINLAASIQHALGNIIANDLPHLIPILMRENAYGAVFGSFLGYSSQNEAGKLPGPTVGALNNQLGNSSPATTFNYLAGKGTTSGIPVDPKVGSDTKSVSNDLLNEIYNGLGGQIVRAPLELWYNTVGKVFTAVGSLGGNFISFILKYTGFDAAFGAALSGLFGANWQQGLATFSLNVIMSLYGIKIDPLAKGPALFNNIFTGGKVALNYHCKVDLGCRKLSHTQKVAVDIQLQQEQDLAMAQTPLWNRLFSLSEPNSLTNNFIRAAPGDMKPGDVLASLFREVGKLPASILAAFSPKLRAAELDDTAMMTGVSEYGAIDATDLNVDIPPELRLKPAGTPCPQVDQNTTFNVCKADSAVARSISCIWGTTCPEFSP
jgi:hypothetical protein